MKQKKILGAYCGKKRLNENYFIRGMTMDKARKEAKEFFNSISKKELIEMLKAAGFEVDENGSGKVLYTDKILDSRESKPHYYTE
jgi:hypothetical protein